VDLITVAQALHWFDRGLFFAECRRVLRAGGALVAYGYSYGDITNQSLADAVFHKVSVKLHHAGSYVIVMKIL
jgi:hypothetical protein